MIAGYIVDFFNPKARIVIELDGSQHYSLDAMEADRKRDACMKANGLKVLRYSNADVNKNFEGVCMDILNNMRSD